MAVERFESERFPYVLQQVVIGERTIEVEALLDTGFDGDIILPLPLIAADRPPNDYRSWALADGSVVETPIYYGTLRLGTLTPREVDVAALGAEAIVGGGVSDHYRVLLDHGERLNIEP